MQKMETAGFESSAKGQECPICLEVFTLPRQLPCLHSFCEHCLRDYITKKIGDVMGEIEGFPCPVCRDITTPSKKGKPVIEWSSLFPQSPISLIAETKLKVERKYTCNICPRNVSTATKFCVMCEEFMCDDCSIYHNRMKMSRNHQILTMEVWKSDLKNLLKVAEGFGCPGHNDKEIEFYCKIHQIACCGACSFLNHKTCTEVIDLKTNLSGLLTEINLQKIIRKMQKLEEHFKIFIYTNERNIDKLESQVNSLPHQIMKIKEKINSILDDMEKVIKNEGNRIFKEELIRKQEQNHQCQSLINAIRNTHAVLETVIQHGSDTQKFLVASKATKQIQSYSDQIRKKFETVNLIRVNLQIQGLLKCIFSENIPELMKLRSIEKSRLLFCKPLHERSVHLDRIINVNYPCTSVPCYTGYINLQNTGVVLADSNNDAVYVCDSLYHISTGCQFQSSPYDMCLTGKNEIAVTLPEIKTIVYLLVRNRSITMTGEIVTRHQCYGIALVSMDNIVVSGHCGGLEGSNMCYWSLLTKDGREKIRQQFDCQWTHETYVALDTSKSRVYVSVSGGNAVYCFGMTDGKQYFVYTSKDLICPLGIEVDKEDIVYVVGYHSHNIHKILADGTSLQVIRCGVSEYPCRIYLTGNGDRIIVTNASIEIGNKLHIFQQR